LDGINGLPRFNMPSNLVSLLGAEETGWQWHTNRPILVMERNAYTSQKCLSDIAGQDLKVHAGSEKRIANIVQLWLFQQSKRTGFQDTCVSRRLSTISMAHCPIYAMAQE
jgi:hypothetical protein